MADFSFFASCPQGLEAVLASEVQALGLQAHLATGGVSFDGSMRDGYLANLWLRTASRVLCLVKTGRYRHEDDIFHLVKTTPWDEWFDLSRTFKVDISAKRCHLKSLDFAALRVKDGVCDYFRTQYDARPDVDTHLPDIRIAVFLDSEQCYLYLDMSNEPLFKRGLRIHQGHAPLKENLAAGLLLIANYDGSQNFLDPMCGSGTLLAEALLIAHRVAPGLNRGFGFQLWKNYDAAIWQTLRSEAQANIKPTREALILGQDISTPSLQQAQENLDELCDLYHLPLPSLHRVDVRSTEAPASNGIIVTNPPYGERLEVKGRVVKESREQIDSKADFFLAVSTMLKTSFDAWQVYLFTSDQELPGQLRLKPMRRTPLYNGALECRLFRFDIRGRNGTPINN